MSKILWVDLEMTGLNPATDRILEVAAIITDWDFEVIDTFEVIIKQSPEVLAQMPPEVEKMHKKSGLTDKIAGGLSEKVAEKELLKFIDKHFTDSTQVLLAGNSIHQDRRFIRKYWPSVDSRLHYRMLDVSAWKVVFANKFKIKSSKKSSHRAIDDITESINELQTYLTHIKTK